MIPRRDFHAGRLGVWVFTGEHFGQLARVYELRTFWGFES